LKRDVNFTDAYIDQLLLNVYAGPGLSEVWIDDLEIGPVIETTTPAAPATIPQATPVKLLPPSNAPRKPNRHALAELNRGQFLVNGKPFFFRGIRHSDTPLETLREAGFNTVWLHHAVTPATIEEAAGLGLWLVPALPVNDLEATSADGFREELAHFVQRD